MCVYTQGAAVCVKCWVDFAKHVKKFCPMWLTSANVVTMTVQCCARALRYVISTSCRISFYQKCTCTGEMCCSLLTPLLLWNFLPSPLPTPLHLLVRTWNKYIILLHTDKRGWLIEILKNRSETEHRRRAMDANDERKLTLVNTVFSPVNLRHINLRTCSEQNW